ncbi:MAG: UxaA family hydrolase [Dehalococcoidales bacterium]|nr:UxaA family hydrolase [Dehalococcoidales bacterium]
MKSNAIRVNAKDNVAVVVHPIKKGSPVVVDGQHLLDTVEDIPLGHKVALFALPRGVAVIRYSEPIVETTQDIPAGGWVHVHNTQPILSDA